MIILFSDYFKKSSKDILIEAAPNAETKAFLTALSNTDIDCLLDVDNLNESIFGWIKDKASDLGAGIKNVALKTLGTLTSFIKTITTTVLDFFNKAYNYITKDITSKLDKNKDVILDKISTHINNSGIEKIKIAQEGKQVLQTTSYIVKYFTSGISKPLQNAASEVSDDETIVQESILEVLKENPNFWKLIVESSTEAQVPILSKIAHKLAHYPPFSYLHKIQAFIENSANNILNKISVLSNKLGGPGPFDFALFGAIVGIVGEYLVKDLAVSAITDIGKFATGVISTALMGAIPGIVVALKAIKYTALSIWVVGVVELIMKSAKAAH